MSRSSQPRERTPAWKDSASLWSNCTPVQPALPQLKGGLVHLASSGARPETDWEQRKPWNSLRFTELLGKMINLEPHWLNYVDMLLFCKYSYHISSISFIFLIKPILPGFYHIFISVFNRLNPGGFYWAGLFRPSLDIYHEDTEVQGNISLLSGQHHHCHNNSGGGGGDRVVTGLWQM